MTIFNNNSFENEIDLFEQGVAAEEFRQGEMVMAKGCSYSLDDFKTGLNLNALIVGGAGTGKTRSIVIPNLHQAVGSYFICDPKGLLHKKYGKYFKDKGYKVRLIDFTHPERSDGYNPMDYMSTTQDMIKLATVITNAKESLGTTSDPYWDRMTTLFISSLIAFLVETDAKEKNFNELLKLVDLAERESDDSKRSKLKSRLAAHKARHPDSWACEKFESVDTAPHKTFDTIRSTLVAKFSQMDTEELRHMMSGERFDFARTAQEKTAVFVTVSDTDRTMDTLVNIFFTQAMNELCSYADNFCEEGRLPIPVRFILDDFATNCRIEEFPRMIASIRSRGLSVMLMVQSEAQLVQGYGHDAQTIISNCDTYVYLGGNDVDTAASVAARCDCPMNEVLYMPVGKCYVFRRGSEPKFCDLTSPEPLIKEMVCTIEKI